ncbi:hypothetical protein SB783_43400, partial [Paraburkholderia sp. SIMBA_009]
VFEAQKFGDIMHAVQRSRVGADAHRRTGYASKGGDAVWGKAASAVNRRESMQCEATRKKQITTEQER